MTAKLVYDDGCRFCTWSAAFAVERGDVVPVALSRVLDGESRLTDDERARLPADVEECAQLVTDRGVYSCGAAVERALVLAGVLPSELAAALRRLPGYVPVREALYRTASNNRDVLSLVLHRDPPVRG